MGFFLSTNVFRLFWITVRNAHNFSQNAFFWNSKKILFDFMLQNNLFLHVIIEIISKVFCLE